MIPNAVWENKNPASPASINIPAYALETPKTPLVSIEDYAVAIGAEHDIDSVRFKRLIACESRWKEDAAGDNGTSFGILQFKTSTFAHFTKKYDLAGYDIENPHHQINLAALMIRDGYLRHWKNCARKTGWVETR